jgi:hypothetical protein
MRSRKLDATKVLRVVDLSDEALMRDDLPPHAHNHLDCARQLASIELEVPLA